MRLHLGAIPGSPDFALNDCWKPLREPGPILLQLFAFPLGIAASAVFATLWFYLTPVASARLGSPIIFLVATFAIIPVHELSHALIHPYFGRSPHTVLGLWPSRLIFYAHFDGELSRNRFVAIIGMPLLVISVLPLLVCMLIGQAPVVVAFLSVFNALNACCDLLVICFLLVQVPNGAIVRNQGWKTYWKIHQTNLD